MTDTEVASSEVPDESKVHETVNLPWNKKMMLEDRKAVVVLNPQTKLQEQRVAVENIVMDFKTFLFSANNRELNHHLNQILTAIKMLMDTCEQQQNDIDDLNGELAELRKHLVI